MLLTAREVFMLVDDSKSDCEFSTEHRWFIYGEILLLVTALNKWSQHILFGHQYSRVFFLLLFFLFFVSGPNLFTLVRATLWASYGNAPCSAHRKFNRLYCTTRKKMAKISNSFIATYCANFWMANYPTIWRYSRGRTLQEKSAPFMVETLNSTRWTFSMSNNRP